MRRFKEDDGKRHREENQLTSFPSLLEEHAVVRDGKDGADQKGDRVQGSLGRIFKSVWISGQKEKDKVPQGSASWSSTHWRSDTSTFGGT
jgi:hypothetical protein